jgi:hypothetical protein
MNPTSILQANIKLPLVDITGHQNKTPDCLCVTMNYGTNINNCFLSVCGDDERPEIGSSLTRILLFSGQVDYSNVLVLLKDSSPNAELSIIGFCGDLSSFTQNLMHTHCSMMSAISQCDTSYEHAYMHIQNSFTQKPVTSSNWGQNLKKLLTECRLLSL